MSTEWPLNMDLWVTMDITHVCKQFTETHSCAQQSHVHGLWPEMHSCAQWTVYGDALLHSGITWTWALTRDAFVHSTRRCFTGHYEYWYWAAQTCADCTLLHYKWTLDYILSSNGLQYREKGAWWANYYGRMNNVMTKAFQCFIRRVYGRPQFVIPQLMEAWETAQVPLHTLEHSNGPFKCEGIRSLSTDADEREHGIYVARWKLEEAFEWPTACTLSTTLALWTEIIEREAFRHYPCMYMQIRRNEVMREAKQEAKMDEMLGDEIDVQGYGMALTWTRGPTKGNRQRPYGRPYKH